MNLKKVSETTFINSSQHEMSLDSTKLKEQQSVDISLQNVRKYAEDHDKESKANTQVRQSYFTYNDGIYIEFLIQKEMKR